MDNTCSECLYYEEHVCDSYEQEKDLIAEKELTEAPAWSLYCASGEAPAEVDGDIVKTVLRTGTWRYSPGPGQKPIAIPLRVVAGHSSDPHKEVGFADILDAFKDGAIEHVTIPLSHEDKVHENTGYINDLWVDDDPGRPGQKRLRASFNFTDPEIQKKVQNRSIANTSVGLLFDYIRKEDGKSYPIALSHVALTNHPWITGLEPFGMAASEENVNDVVHLVLDQTDVEPDEDDKVIWSTQNSNRYLEEQVNKSLQSLAGTSPEGSCPYWLRDIMGDSALVTNEMNGETFVVPFSVDNGEVTIAQSQDWVAAKQEWIAASEALGQKRVTETVTEEKPQTSNKNQNGGTSMSDVLEGLELADDVRSTLERALDAQKEVDRLRAEARKREVDDRVGALKAIGFSEQPDLLAYVRNVLLSDTGSTALNLSEGGSDKKLTASDVLEGFIERLPQKDGKVNFGEQATDLGTSEVKPELNADNENKLARKDRVKLAEDFLYNPLEED